MGPRTTSNSVSSNSLVSPPLLVVFLKSKLPSKLMPTVLSMLVQKIKELVKARKLPSLIRVVSVKKKSKEWLKKQKNLLKKTKTKRKRSTVETLWKVMLTTCVIKSTTKKNSVAKSLLKTKKPSKKLSLAPLIGWMNKKMLEKRNTTKNSRSWKPNATLLSKRYTKNQVVHLAAKVLPLVKVRVMVTTSVVTTILEITMNCKHVANDIQYVWL